MKKINLNIGSTVYFKDEEYIIFKQVDFNSIIAINNKKNKKETLEIKYLKAEAQKDVTHIYYDDIPDKDWNEAKRRLKILKPILTKEKTKEEASNDNNIHITTIYRWLN
ncbi:MAG: hypothetical protein C0626_05010 [Arcobacter sp.]|nr:MAG: hypothetical protein C0626_05010 [Arcobacter sp.]